MSQVGTIEMSGNYIRFQIQIAGKPVWFLTHAYPHADEIFSAVLMEKFGTDEFVQKYARHGVIRVGVMFDVFDEHHVPGSEEKTEECAATLVAKVLGVYDNPELWRTLKYVKQIDIEGKDHPDAVGTLIKKAHEANRNRTARVINWAQTAFRAKIAEEKSSGDFRSGKIGALLLEQYPEEPQIAQHWEQTLCECLEFQRQVFEQALKELEGADKREISGPSSGRKLKLIIVQSDNNEISKAARSAYEADIVVQRRTTGNVHIFTDRRANLKLFTLARMLRLEEQKALGNVVETNWRRLSDEGMCPSGVWYFHHNGQFLLNGSLTAQNVPPTALTMEQVVELTEISVDTARFEPSRAAFCQIGECPASRENPCPWYDWGLNQCREARKGKLERTGKITKE